MSRPVNSRSLPWRAVLWARPSDPRHPIYQDMHLACQHVLAHRPLKRGADGRYHRPKRLRCPLCAQAAALAATRHRPAAPAPPAFARAEAPSQDTGPVGLIEGGDDAQPAVWSPRDLAARTWD